jgi:hypothetical protein
MAIINKGTAFSNGEQLSAGKLNDLIDEATFGTDSVDNASTLVNASGAITVRDGGITQAKLATNSVTTIKIADGNIPPSKLSTGGPSWGNGTLTIDGTGVAGGLEVNSSVSGTGSAFVDFHTTSATNPDYDVRILADSAGLQIINKDSDTIFSNGALEEQRMRIDLSGNLLVNSALYGDGLYDGDSFKVAVGPSTAGGLKCSRQGTVATNQIAFLNPNGQVGFINTDGSTTTYGTTSDYRLKEDITSIDNSIERLNQLKPCNFAWKVDGTRMDGFIAHEVQEVVPIAATGTKDAVKEDGTPDYQGIDQAKLIPLLTKALQEAIARIEVLEAK